MIDIHASAVSPPGAPRRTGDGTRPLHALMAVVLAIGAAACQAEDRGRQLFEGTIALPGTITGQSKPLQPRAARCVNCHAVDDSARGVAASFGPPLTANWLTAAVSRRRGPPSRYDATSFCTLLRTGIDPAFIVAAQTMPRYAVSDADCADLWRHLATAAPSPKPTK